MAKVPPQWMKLLRGRSHDTGCLRIASTVKDPGAGGERSGFRSPLCLQHRHGPRPLFPLPGTDNEETRR
jgi:hypothetical protein